MQADNTNKKQVVLCVVCGASMDAIQAKLQDMQCADCIVFSLVLVSFTIPSNPFNSEYKNKGLL